MNTHAVLIQFHKVKPHMREWLMVSLLPAHRFKSTTIGVDDPVATYAIGSRNRTAHLYPDRMVLKADKTTNELHIREIEVRKLVDAESAIAEVRNGRAHGVAMVPQKYWEGLKKDDLLLRSYDLRTWWFVALNTKRGPLADPRLRQALDLSVDRQVLRSRLDVAGYRGDANPATELISGPFIQSSPDYNRKVGIPQPDPAKAAELITSLGWTQAGGVWTDASGPIVLRVGIADEDAAELSGALSAVRDQLRAAGFTVEAEVVAGGWPGRDKDIANQFDLFIGRWHERWLFTTVGKLFATAGLRQKPS